ncbi:uncharacterized protein LOC100120897 isoform X3 [Nasonia vitripennis]|uniref:Uncharacterized protein n=1 Tax=Nasonia vitripennis TaxID=7425 RepID=A0A7M7PZE9_NASVI|nr:uncharacterized protein LOC100120897 isoform X3 [Nasonia vitripennis]
MIIVHRLISVGYIRISIEHVPKSNIDSSSSIATDSRNTNSLTCNKKESRAGIRCSSSFHIGAQALIWRLTSPLADRRIDVQATAESRKRTQLLLLFSSSPSKTARQHQSRERSDDDVVYLCGETMCERLSPLKFGDVLLIEPHRRVHTETPSTKVVAQKLYYPCHCALAAASSARLPPYAAKPEREETLSRPSCSVHNRASSAR